MCQKGECKDSICLKYGLSSCFLTSELISDKRQLCELACEFNNTCQSTSELAKNGHLPDSRLARGGLSLRPGSPCDNFQVSSIFEEFSGAQKLVLRSSFRSWFQFVKERNETSSILEILELLMEPKDNFLLRF